MSPYSDKYPQARHSYGSTPHLHWCLNSKEPSGRRFHLETTKTFPPLPSTTPLCLTNLKHFHLWILSWGCDLSSHLTAMSVNNILKNLILISYEIGQRTTAKVVADIIPHSAKGPNSMLEWTLKNFWWFLSFQTCYFIVRRQQSFFPHFSYSFYIVGCMCQAQAWKKSTLLGHVCVVSLETRVHRLPHFHKMLYLFYSLGKAFPRNAEQSSYFFA